MEGGTERAVPIDEHVSHAVHETVNGVGEVPGDLFHPGLVGIRRATGKVDTSRGDLHNEQEVVGDEATLCPHFKCGEVDSTEYIPVSF